MKKALRDITAKVEKMFDLQKGDIVLDIGSNDGSLLRTYTVPGLITVGVEPADNLEEEGKQGLSHHIHDFWNYGVYEKTMRKKAKIITAIGMFYDMEDPNDFIADWAKALTEDGVFIAMEEESFDKNNQLLKTKVFSFKKIGDYYVMNRLKVENVQKKHSTLLTVNDISLDNNFEDSMFIIRNLKKLPN